MKTIAALAALAFIQSVPIAAQGVHLNAGDVFSFGFNSVSGCYFTEASPGAEVIVVFGLDRLSSGESLRLEMFENDITNAPFETRVFSPGEPDPIAVLAGPRSHWLDGQGVIQLTMLNGSVDVDYGHFFVSPNA